MRASSLILAREVLAAFGRQHGDQQLSLLVAAPDVAVRAFQPKFSLLF
ncbi:MAG: hypothetical protein JSS04_05870 [Proteobacteria bacterium]|nr:hypothetical protein [Pseudomonadota bacterium]